MSNYGCLKCGASNNATRPDEFYTELRMKFKKDIDDDYIKMTRNCWACWGENEIYWYKPETT